jgi:hypothetical protein
VSLERKDFIFKLVGEGMDLEAMKKYAIELGIDKNMVVFTGLLEGKALVTEMASADLMVVFSNYENFPVVINESFVLGVPVIATRVGGIPEFVTDDKGRLIKPGDEKALEKLLIAYLNKKLSFNNNLIRSQSRDEYSPEKIGKDIGIFTAGGKRSASAAGRPAPKKIIEVEAIGPAGAGMGMKASPSRLLESLPEGVIFLALFGVTEDFIGLVDFLELLFSPGVVRVHVGMILPGQTAKRLLDFSLRSTFVNPENGIIIFSRHHIFLSQSSRFSGRQFAPTRNNRSFIYR